MHLQWTTNAQSKHSDVSPPWPCGHSIHVCSEGADISEPLQEVVLVEHQTRNPDSDFTAADQHWTDEVCCVQHSDRNLCRSYFSVFLIHCPFASNSKVKK